MWKTDKVNFKSSNLMCVYRHSKFKIKNLFFLFPTNFQKSNSKCFSCQNRKLEISIDGLIISGSVQSFTVTQQSNKFCKINQNCSLSDLVNFFFLHFAWSVFKLALEKKIQKKKEKFIKFISYPDDWSIMC